MIQRHARHLAHNLRPIRPRRRLLVQPGRQSTNREGVRRDAAELAGRVFDGVSVDVEVYAADGGGNVGGHVEGDGEVDGVADFAGEFGAGGEGGVGSGEREQEVGEGDVLEGGEVGGEEVEW